MKRVALGAAVLAAGLTIVGPAAAAPPAVASAADYPTADWGPYASPYAGGGRALASGRVRPDPDDGSFRFQARVYDRNPSSRMCGYIRIKYVGEEGNQPTPSSAKKCGRGGYARLDYRDWEEHVPEAYLIQVCQWDNRVGVRKHCGKWRYAFRFQPEGTR